MCFAVSIWVSLHLRYLTGMLFLASKVGWWDSSLIFKTSYECILQKITSSRGHQAPAGSLRVVLQSVWAFVKSDSHCYSTSRYKLYSANKNHLSQSALTIHQQVYHKQNQQDVPICSFWMVMTQSVTNPSDALVLGCFESV